MNKFFNKFIKKTNETDSVSRITSDTVAEHREKILAGGRRFKYPIQYVKHKLVFNAIAISLVALTSVVFLIWWQLYSVQNTGEFMYRITKFIPVPVANVDGETVLYSDYLMKYRSSVHYLESKEQVNLKSEDGIRQIEYIKQKSLQDAIEDSFADKLAREIGISLDQKELEAFLVQQRKSNDGEISEQTYESVIADYYDWSPSEYRHAVERKLLKQKVAYAIDSDSRNQIDIMSNAIKANPSLDFKKLVESTNKTLVNKIEYGQSGWVPKDNQDGGLADAVSSFNNNAVTGIIESSLGDGYYIVRLLDRKASTVNYEYIKVPLFEFSKRLNDLKNQNKIIKYITIEEI